MHQSQNINVFQILCPVIGEGLVGRIAEAHSLHPGPVCRFNAGTVIIHGQTALGGQLHFFCSQQEHFGIGLAAGDGVAVGYGIKPPVLIALAGAVLVLLLSIRRSN